MTLCCLKQSQICFEIPLEMLRNIAETALPMPVCHQKLTPRKIIVLQKFLRFYPGTSGYTRHILMSWSLLEIKPVFTVRCCQDLWLMWTDKKVSTINYLWPSKLSYHCSLTQRKGLLCYCWTWVNEGGRWNKACISACAWPCDVRWIECACVPVCLFLGVFNVTVQMWWCAPCAVCVRASVCHSSSLCCVLRSGKAISVSVPESERKRSSGSMQHGAVQESTWELRENKQIQRRKEEEEAGWGVKLNTWREKEKEGKSSYHF